jgi:asparagine N-glycosylation enzyme membrane subunit Stt3
MNLAELQTYFNEYNQAYESGQISKEEYTNLLRGLEVEQVITSTAEELEFKENLNTAINAAINVATALA